jgi:HEAT repeat protein
MRTLRFLTLALAVACSGWEDQVASQADRVRAEAPALAEAVATTPAVRMRNGQYRLAPSAELDDPRALPLLLERLNSHADRIAVRRAVAEASARHLLDDGAKGVWKDAWLSLAADHDDAEVRAVMVAAMRHADKTVALPGLTRAIDDRSPAVRRAAAQGLGWHPEGAQGADALLKGLRDTDPAVRAVAARSIGWHKPEAGWTPLVDRLRDDDGVVRREALAALLRIDETRALGMSEVQALRIDPFARAAFSR